MKLTELWKHLFTTGRNVMPGMPKPPEPPSPVQMAIDILPVGLSTAPGIMVWKLVPPPESALLHLAFNYDEDAKKSNIERPIILQMALTISRTNLDELL